jgi:hypothetical protein
MAKGFIAGAAFLIVAIGCFAYFYTHLPAPGVEAKGDVLLWGIDLNGIVSLLGGLISLIASAIALFSKRRSS